MKLVRKYWLNAASCIIFSLLGFSIIAFVYLQGIEFGKIVGRCEAACFATGGFFIALEEDNHCQCQSAGKIKWIYSVQTIPPDEHDENEGGDEGG